MWSRAARYDAILMSSDVSVDLASARPRACMQLRRKTRLACQCVISIRRVWRLSVVRDGTMAVAPSREAEKTNGHLLHSIFSCKGRRGGPPGLLHASLFRFHRGCTVVEFGTREGADARDLIGYIHVDVLTG
jgi:hypothetical protein